MGYKRRPWPVVLLAGAHVFLPVANVLVGAWASHLEIKEYLHSLHATRPLPFLFLFYGYPFLMGLAVFFIQKSTWFIACTCAVGILLVNILQQILNGGLPIGAIAIAVFSGIAFMAYLALPSVRRLFFDRRVRWWESQPRYLIQKPTRIYSAEHTEDESSFIGEIVDLSVGGALLQSDKNWAMHDKIKIQFEAEGSSFELKGQIVYMHPMKKDSAGIQFYSLTRKDRKKLKELVSALQDQGIQERTPQEPAWNSFKTWFHALLTTGKGWTPEALPKKKS